MVVRLLLISLLVGMAYPFALLGPSLSSRVMKGLGGFGGVAIRLFGSQSQSHTPKMLSEISIGVSSESEMEMLGAMVASGVHGSGTIFLNGDLGSGKTCFARGFVRAKMSDDNLRGEYR